MTSRCEDCGLFIRNTPDFTEYDAGVDAEWEFGQEKYGGEIIRTPWHTITETRTCRSCGYNNKTEVDE
jgi:rubredoxin